MNSKLDPFGAKDVIETDKGPVTIYRLSRLGEAGIGDISHLPYSIRILLESLLRNVDGELVRKEDVISLASWNPKNMPQEDIPFIPSRIVLQDFTGVPSVVDIAAIRSAMHRLGGDPSKINPVIPADLVIDHSIQVDYYGTSYALTCNEKKDFERNHERYGVLRWAQDAFNNFRVVPPGRGIVHQVNLEYLASVVHFKKGDGNDELIAYPDTLVGTDSHTTMINGLGVLGWGVGGIEAEAVMLGQPYYMPVPEVVGFRLYGELNEGVTATDLVLTVTQMLRAHGVVGKFVEFYGVGVSKLSLPDRATIANMAPEYGATMGFFPVDEETLEYMLRTGRKKEHVDMVGLYCKEQGLFVTDNSPVPVFSDTLELDMSTVKPCLSGPKRPQDRILLEDMPESFHGIMQDTFAKRIEAGAGTTGMEAGADYNRWMDEGGYSTLVHTHIGHSAEDYKGGVKDKIKNKIKNKIPASSLNHGSIVIAAITSCTNTSNPSVMIAAGLLAKNAVERGLKVNSCVKTSLAPGSRVVTDYFTMSGLLPYLEALGFHVVGYGCTTCIGNSGPLSEDIADKVRKKDLTVAAVLSGNRNFEGRINPLVKANYLASPPLVIAYAIAGTVDIDLTNEPLGFDPNGIPVYLKDIWPRHDEIQQIIAKALKSDMFKTQYSKVLEGAKLWKYLDVLEGTLYEWDSKSSYIQEPPFFKDFPLVPAKMQDIKNARVLALLGDSITTDHISPAGAFADSDPAGKYLIARGLDVAEFNSYGSRRGNHEVMMRGTFANVRLRNKLVPEREGGWTLHHPTGNEMTIYDAAMNYTENDAPLIVIAGHEYGTGSSRDWAAKGTLLLGVKAVIAESFERIHRSNLVGLGVLPLQFKDGESAENLGLKGDEYFDILGIADVIPKGELEVVARGENGEENAFNVIVRLDSPVDVEYYRNGGILHTFLRSISLS